MGEVADLDHASVASVGEANATMLRRDLKTEQTQFLHLFGDVSGHRGSFVVLLRIIALLDIESEERKREERKGRRRERKREKRKGKEGRRRRRRRKKKKKKKKKKGKGKEEIFSNPNRHKPPKSRLTDLVEEL